MILILLLKTQRYRHSGSNQPAYISTPPPTGVICVKLQHNAELSPRNQTLSLTLLDARMRVINFKDSCAYPLKFTSYGQGADEWVVLANLDPEGVFPETSEAVGETIEDYSELTPESFSDRWVLVTCRHSLYSDGRYIRQGVYDPGLFAGKAFGIDKLPYKDHIRHLEKTSAGHLVNTNPGAPYTDVYIEYSFKCPEARYAVFTTKNPVNAARRQYVSFSNIYDRPKTLYKDHGIDEPEILSWSLEDQLMRTFKPGDVVNRDGVSTDYVKIFSINDSKLTPLTGNVADILGDVSYD